MITEEQAIALEQVAVAITELQHAVFNNTISIEAFAGIVDTCVEVVENAVGLLGEQAVKQFVEEFHKT